MKKLSILIILSLGFANVTHAGEDIKKDDFTFKYSGLIGGYYGIMEQRDLHNVQNHPNRWVNRTDTKLSIEYELKPDYKLSLHSNVTLIFKEHDTSYRTGEWRFYPYIELEAQKAKMSVGYTFNSAYLLHKGARDISMLGITDSNITYFLTNPNWRNTKHSTKFATPKSTKIMNDGRAAKLNYISPKIAGTTFGFSYTPKNEHRRGMVSRYVDYSKKEDAYVFGLAHEFKTDLIDIHTSLGYGIFNRTDKELSLGLSLEKGNFYVATGYKKAYVDGNSNPLNNRTNPDRLPEYFDNYRESWAWDISMGYKWGAYKTNIAYLHTQAENTRHQDNIIIFSNVYSLNKWVDVYGIGAYINSKGEKRDTRDNEKGYAIITGVGIKF